MIDNDNEKVTKVWKSTFFELTSDIQVTNPKLFLRSVGFLFSFDYYII